MARTKTNGTNTSTATIGFEAKLWLTAEQAVSAPHFAEAEYNGGRPQGLLDLMGVGELTPYRLGNAPLLRLDLVVDSKNRKLIPNPEHGDKQMSEEYGEG